MKNILLIENNEGNIKQIVNAISPENHNIEVADSLSRALELSLRILPVLIVCNTAILSRDKEDVFQKLRAQQFLSTTPFIFIIENGKSSNPFEKNFAKETDYYIKAPYTDEEIKTIINIALQKHQLKNEESEKRLNALRSSISFALPHEFFTPLNSIIGFSEILMKEFGNLSKEDFIQMLGYINSDALRLKRITENFLVYAQLEMISAEPSRLSVIKDSYFISPKELITHTANEIAKRNGRLDDLVLELEDAVIRMNESYVKKLIYELIDNAFKFSEKGSSVIVNMLSNDSSVLLSINDHGRGMSPEHIKSIGAYMQFNREIYEHQGSGLGLIISKKIVEVHGGTFDIESLPGEGTKVNMIFDS